MPNIRLYLGINHTAGPLIVRLRPATRCAFSPFRCRPGACERGGDGDLFEIIRRAGERQNGIGGLEREISEVSCPQSLQRFVLFYEQFQGYVSPFLRLLSHWRG